VKPKKYVRFPGEPALQIVLAMFLPWVFGADKSYIQRQQHCPAPNTKQAHRAVQNPRDLAACLFFK